MGIRAALQTSLTRQTSSKSARDDAKLCLRNPNQQPSWLDWRKESALMGCFTVLGLGNPLEQPCNGAAAMRRQFLRLSIPACFPDSLCCFFDGGSASQLNGKDWIVER